jgi:RimJ/RimL family protein N-acetyltransferase
MYKQGKYFYRPIEFFDLDWSLALHNDPDTLYMLTDTTLVSRTQQEKWIEALQYSNKSKRLVLEYDGSPIGLARLDDIDYTNRNICVGLDIIKEFRGKGHGNAGFKLLLDYCFKELNMHRAWLFVLDTNARAVSLYTKLGFVQEGEQRERLYRDGVYHNYIMMSLLKREWN